MYFTDGQSALFANVFLSLVVFGTSAIVLYWAGTIENNIENNPDK